MTTSVKEAGRYPLALGRGEVLGERYELDRLLSGGSACAFTYLALDRESEQEVVLKELFPRALVGRGADGLTVVAHSPETDDVFARCRRRFLRDAELLTETIHPGLPRIVAAFPGHGTAYFASALLDGRSLADLLAAEGPIAAGRAIAMISRLLGAVQALHAEGIVHGAISPDNILVREDESPVLLGLGTTRNVLGAVREPMPGFAAIEQFASRDVGPWTDVHGCAAVLYTMLTGSAPMSAVERATGRALAPPQTASGLLPPGLAQVITGALSIRPEGRPHSADELRRRLETIVDAPHAEPVDHQRPIELVFPMGDGLKVGGVDDAAPPAGIAAMLASLTSVADDPPERPIDRLRGASNGRFALAATALVALLVLTTVALSGAGGVPDRSAGSDVSGAPPANALVPDAVRLSGTPGLPPPSVDSSVRIPAAGTGAAPSSTDWRPDQPTTDVPPRERRSADQKPAEPRSNEPWDAIARVSAVPVALPEAVPAGVTIALREQMTQGVVKAEFGDYADARRLFTAATERVAELSGRHTGDAGLAALQAEITAASARARRACTAENTVLRARNLGTIQCE